MTTSIPSYPVKCGIQTRFCRPYPADLGAAGDEDDLIPDTSFHAQVGKFFHLLAMDVIMADDGGNKDGMRARLKWRHLPDYYWNGRAKDNGISHHIFQSRHVCVQNFPQTYTMLISPTVAATTVRPIFLT